MNKILLVMGIFILVIGLAYLLITGDMSNGKFIFAAGGIYIAFAYAYQQYPKISKILLIIFSIIIILAMVMVLAARFT